MAVGDAIVIFQVTGFTPAAGVEICLTSFHNSDILGKFGNSDNPVTTQTWVSNVSNGVEYLNANPYKLFITNTNPYYANNAALGATGIQIK